MATAKRNGNGNKGNGNHEAQINGDTLKTIEQGGEPPRIEDEAKLDKRFLQVSDGSCISQLEKAFGFGKSAIHLECAVALALFTFSDKGADRETKRHAMDLYGKAGYDVNPNGEDYKTINRRVNAFATLYEYEERQAWMDAMDNQMEEQAIEALKNFLIQEYNFKGINDILAAAGKPVKQYAVAASRAGKGTSTKAGGQAGTAAPQGTPGAGGTNEAGMPLTKEGTVDKRVAPEGGQSLSTQQAQEQISKEEADAQAGKQVSPEDQATAAKLGERMAANRQVSPAEMKRRKEDTPDAIVFHTANIHVALPRNIEPDEVKEMALQLLQFAAEQEAKTSSRSTARGKDRQANMQH